MTTTRKDLTPLAFTLVLGGLLLLSYLPSFFGAFLGDDIGRIQFSNPPISLGNIFNQELGDRPVLLFSVWLDLVSFGMNLGLMRLENMGWVLAIAFAVRTLSDRLASAFNVSVVPWFRDSVLILFFLHPIHTQTFTHVIQRGILISSLGGIIATILLLESQLHWRRLPYKFAILAWIIALLAKPNIASLPIFWLFLFIPISPRTRLWALLPFFLLLVLPIMSYVWGEYNLQTTEATPLSYFLIQAKSLLIYIRLIIIPVGLNFNHDLLSEKTLYWWPNGALWFVYLAALGVLWWVSKSVLRRTLLAGFVIAFLPESSFFPIFHPVFEHRVFFPLLFLALYLIFSVNSPSSKRLGPVFFLLILCYVGLSYSRNRETQTYAGWAQSTLSNTCNYSYYYFHSVSVLIKDKEYEAARRVLGNVDRCEGGAWIRDCLNPLINISQDRPVKVADVNTVASCIHSDVGIDKFHRFAINRVVFSALLETKLPKRACVLEDYLSQQLRYLRRFPADFKNEIDYYAFTAEKCLAEISRSTQEEDTFQALKIRTIKLHHFGIPDPNLEEDLRKAPNDDRTKYLRNLFELTPK